MTFLSPMAGIVGAAIAVPILLALYLLKLRRKPLRVSSVLLWEQAVQDLQANVPLRWLRASWLLLLQLVGLGLLLVALARPALESPTGVAARTVIIIDRSASMSATDGVNTEVGSNGTILPVGASEPFTRLDQAKVEARRIIEEVRRSSAGSGGSRPEAMVVALASEARVLAPFTSDGATLREAVDLATATDQPGNLRATLDLTRAMSIGLDSENESVERTRVVLISDGSFETSNVREGLPSGMDFALIPVGPAVAENDQAERSTSDPEAADFDNLAIGAIAARRDSEDPAKVRVFVRVENAAARAIEAGVSLRVNDQPAGLRVVEIPRAGIDGTLGQAAVSFDFEGSEAALLVVTIARPDRLSADNTAALVLRAAKRARVVMVGPGKDPADPYSQARGDQGIDRFLIGLFAELDLSSVRRVSAAEYERLASSPGGVGADLVVFDRVLPQSLPEVATISIGAGLPDGTVRVDPAEESAGATRFVLWRREHPLLRSVPLDAVLISPPMRMTIAEPPEAGKLDTPGRPRFAVESLASGSNGPLMALQTGPGGSGVKRLVIGFDLLRTNWGPDVSFPVFFGGAVEYLTGRGEAAAASGRNTAEPVSVGVGPGVRELKLNGPIERVIPVLADDANQRRSVAIGALERAGVYRVDGAERDDRVIAVNLLDQVESAIRSRRTIRLGNTGARIAERASDTEPARREVWHWFVLAAAGVLAVEGLAFARAMRG